MTKFQEWFKAQPLGFKGRVAVSELDDYAACWNAAIDAAVQVCDDLDPIDAPADTAAWGLNLAADEVEKLKEPTDGPCKSDQ